MKSQIAYTKNKFRYCPEWPEEPKWIDKISEHVPDPLVNFGPGIPMLRKSEYEKIITSALENGIPFKDQEKVSNFLKPKEFTDVDAVWRPNEGDHWDCPKGMNIGIRKNYSCELDEMQCSETCHGNTESKEKCSFCIVTKFALFSMFPDTQEKIEGEGENKCYCGDLTWTIKKYGRITHKEFCPARTEIWHQGNSKPIDLGKGGVTIKIKDLPSQGKFNQGINEIKLKPIAELWDFISTQEAKDFLRYYFKRYHAMKDEAIEILIFEEVEGFRKSTLNRPV